MLALAPAACTVTPEQEAGPFYISDEMLRNDISENKPGVMLLLTIALLDARTCRPLVNAAVDVWHCDASGVYSGYSTASLGPGGLSDPEAPGDTPPGPPPSRDGDPAHHGPPPGGPPPQMKPTDKLTFCRGIQLTNSVGEVTFKTIFPGFYQGRVNHIHLKARVDGKANGRTYESGHISHTGQIFFPESLAIKIMQQEPYSAHHIHRTTMAEDGVYNEQGGSSAVASLGPYASSYRALIALSIDPTATPKDAGRGGPPPQA